jgi:hypothetical protein
MKCDCIEKVNKKLRSATGDPETSVSLMLTFPELKGIVYIPYTFREKKSNGRFGKEKAGKLALSKCPFCGKEQQ